MVTSTKNREATPLTRKENTPDFTTETCLQSPPLHRLNTKEYTRSFPQKERIKRLVAKKKRERTRATFIPKINIENVDKPYKAGLGQRSLKYSRDALKGAGAWCFNKFNKVMKNKIIWYSQIGAELFFKHAGVTAPFELVRSHSAEIKVGRCYVRFR